jgi:hypothetical protein
MGEAAAQLRHAAEERERVEEQAGVERAQAVESLRRHMQAQLDEVSERASAHPGHFCCGDPQRAWCAAGWGG